MAVNTILKFVILLSIAAGLTATDKKKDATLNKETPKSIRYCQYQTPCGWKIYDYVDNTVVHLNNDYCECSSGQKCQFHENRSSEGYIEYRCKSV